MKKGDLVPARGYCLATGYGGRERSFASGRRLGTRVRVLNLRTGVLAHGRRRLLPFPRRWRSLFRDCSVEVVGVIPSPALEHGTGLGPRKWAVGR